MDILYTVIQILSELQKIKRKCEVRREIEKKELERECQRKKERERERERVDRCSGMRDMSVRHSVCDT